MNYRKKLICNVFITQAPHRPIGAGTGQHTAQPPHNFIKMTIIKIRSLISGLESCKLIQSSVTRYFISLRLSMRPRVPVLHTRSRKQQSASGGGRQWK